MNARLWNVTQSLLPMQEALDSPFAAYVVLGASLILASCLWFALNLKSTPAVSNSNGSSQGPSSDRAITDSKKRSPGSWTPEEFKYPDITPHPSNPLEIQQIPYRPFRSGEYHVTMGIRTMPWSEWIELDNQYEKYYRIRQHRISTRGQNVVRVQPENPGVVMSGTLAAIELVHEMAEYLSRRYPTTFQVARHPARTEGCYEGWYGLPAIKSITILPLHETYELPMSGKSGQGDAEEALRIAALLVQEDLALMVEGEALKSRSTCRALLPNVLDSSKGMTAGITFKLAQFLSRASFWRMQDKIGLPLDEIHNSGNVPRYKEKLQMSMERFFQKMTVDKPVNRNNYFFQVISPSGAADGSASVDPEELAWAESSHGPEDEYTHSFPEEQPTRPQVKPSNIRLRTERQSLRRLPRSGAIVFGIRTYLTPIEQIGKEPNTAKRLASALRGWGDDIGVYKGKFTGGWWDEALRYLDECSAGEEEIIETKFPF